MQDGQKDIHQAKLIADLTTAEELAKLGMAKAEIDKNKAVRKAALDMRKDKDAEAEKARQAKVKERQKQAAGAQSVGDLIPDGPDRIDPRNIQAPGTGAAGIQEAVAGGRAVQAGGQTHQAPANIVEGQVNTGGRTIDAGAGVFIGTPTQETQTRVRQNALTPGDVLRAQVTQEGQRSQDAIENRRLEYEKVIEREKMIAREKEHDAEIAIRRERLRSEQRAQKFQSINDLVKTGAVSPRDATKATDLAFAGKWDEAADVLGPASKSFQDMRDKLVERGQAEIEGIRATTKLRESQAGLADARADEKLMELVNENWDARSSIYGTGDKRSTGSQQIDKLTSILSGEDKDEIPADWSATQSVLVPLALEGDNPAIIAVERNSVYDDVLAAVPLQDVMDEMTSADGAKRVTKSEHPTLYMMGYRAVNGRIEYQPNRDPKGDNREAARATDIAYLNLSRGRLDRGDMGLSYRDWMTYTQSGRLDQLRQRSTAGQSGADQAIMDF